MVEELQFLINSFVGLFVIIDPFAVLPVYLSMSDRFDDEAKRHIRRKAVVIALIILYIFCLTGLSLFKFFSITLPAFQIAGGILLLVFGIEQLNHKRERLGSKEKIEVQSKDDVSIFPLATPLLAGPGAISTVVLYSSKVETALRMSSLLIAVALVLLSTYVLLTLGPQIKKLLGHTGLNLLTRMMGIIVCAIAVQFIINGIKGAFAIP